MYSIKFRIGDKVWPIYSTSTTVKVKCDICDGAKKIYYRNRLLKCPECAGTGIKKEIKKIWAVGKESKTIQAIHIRKDDKITCEFPSRDYGYVESYIDQEHAFLTKREAQDFCDVINKGTSC